MKLLLSIFLLTCSCLLSAEEKWLSPIRNYTKSEYRAGTQNWMLFRDNSGWIYSANNEGLLLYDGHEWELFPSGALRVLLKGEDGRLYAGSYNEFGYYEAGPDGHPWFKTLSDSIHVSINNFSDIWDIYQIKNDYYFISYHYIFRLSGNEITSMESPERILASAAIEDRLYTFREGKGIFLMEDSQFIPLPETEILGNKNVVSILQYDDRNIVFITEYDGIFILSDSGLRHMETDIDGLLKNSQVYCASIWRDLIYVGTIKNGLFIIDLKGGKTLRYDTCCGLQNNSVLSLDVTPQGNVWLGLDNGISYIELASPVSNLYAGNQNYGVGYASIITDGKLYIGTNHGLFYTDWPIDDVYNLPIRQVNGIDGQVWSLTEINGTLFCGDNNGAFIIENDSAELVCGKDGFWNFQSVPGSPDRIIGGTYNGLITFINHGSRTAPDWRFEKRLTGLDVSCLKVEYDKYDDSWWIAYDKGKCRVKYDSGSNAIKDIKDFPDSAGHPVTSIFKDNDRVYCTSSEGISYYEPGTGTFLRSRKWMQRMQEHGYLRILNIDRYNNVWYIKDGELRRNYPSGTSFRTDSLGMKCLEGNMMNNYENVCVIDENSAVIGTLAGFSRYDISSGISVSDDYYDFAVRRIVFSSGQEETVHYQNSGIPENDDSDKPVINRYKKESSYRFEMNPSEEICCILYEVQLKGVNRLPVEMDASGIKEYTGLTEGNYTFTARSTDLFTNETQSVSVRFKILPPWYRSIAAYVLYLLTISGICYWMFHFLKRYIRLQNYKQLIAQQKESYKIELALKSEVLEKEKAIVELRNEALEQDLRIKSQELANSMFNIIQKREIFLFMKEELSKISRALSSENQEEARRKINRLSDKIRQNIDEEESWKKLEDNFNIVHNNFMTRLKDRYPNLSSNDLKLAAYIRMDLLTKEIAPLLNISERGLESARFRLRKKLGLGRNESLSEFLKNF